MFDKKSFHKLKNRSFIKLQGKDQYSFIQGIMSNDVNNLKKVPSIYSSILTPQGRFISDFFLIKYKDSIILDVKSDDEDRLLTKFNLYKLRSEVEIKVLRNICVYLISKDSENHFKELQKNILCFNDPRFENFFKRLYFIDYTDQLKVEKLGLSSISDNDYNSIRLKNSVPDFSIDCDKNKSLLMEMRFDELNGISWTKGCYMGQEITARMKYRNLMKKKLFKVEIDFRNKLDNEIKIDEQLIGMIYSHNKINGLGYFNLKYLDKFLNKTLKSGDSLIKIKKLWWDNS